MNKNERKYIGFYTDNESFEKLNFIAGTLYHNNRSDYINQTIKKSIDDDYKKAVAKINLLRNE